MFKDIVHLLDSNSLSRVSVYGGCDNAIASFSDYFLNFLGSFLHARRKEN
jgi:hypothetical protein